MNSGIPDGIWVCEVHLFVEVLQTLELGGDETGFVFADRVVVGDGYVGEICVRVFDWDG